jgi:DNA-directed RNA polymerase subunit M/transcription elongation factor TFIIS
MKFCNGCQNVLNIDLFYNDKSQKDGKRPKCKQCELTYLKNSYNNNPEKYRKKSKTWRENNKEKSLNKKLAVDHCHNTGKIRGLLCVKCNKVLGLMKDNINLFNNAINYLEENK